MEVSEQFMNLKFDEIKKYGLHDTEIDNVEINDGTLLINFSSGIFYLDSFGKELAKSKNCKIIFEIGGLNKQNVYEYLEIFKKRKNTVKELKFDNFKKMHILSQWHLFFGVVSVQMYSPFFFFIGLLFFFLVLYILL